MSGIELIYQERKRQMDEEGYSSDHDDDHTDRQLARAAQAYVEYVISRGWRDPDFYHTFDEPPDSWPWSEEDWNPQNPIRDLVKAGALIAAEIDRLNRKDGAESANS